MTPYMICYSKDCLFERSTDRWMCFYWYPPQNKDIFLQKHLQPLFQNDENKILSWNKSELKFLLLFFLIFCKIFRYLGYWYSILAWSPISVKNHIFYSIVYFLQIFILYFVGINIKKKKDENFAKITYFLSLLCVSLTNLLLWKFAKI